MNVIFEGVDRVGKSTLIKSLAARYGAEVNKMRVPTNEQESREFYLEHFAALAKPAKHPVFWDRGHVSELVYAPLYRSLSVGWSRTIQDLARHTPNTYFVYVRPLSVKLLEPDERPGANIRKELAGYRTQIKKVPWPVLSISTHHDRARWRGLSELVEEVFLWLLEKEGYF